MSKTFSSLAEPLRRFLHAVCVAHPDVEIGAFPSPAGCDLELTLGPQHVAVRWSDDAGFAFSVVGDEPGLGAGHDECVQSASGAARRVVELLRPGATSRPPLGVVLRELRLRSGVSQVELARRLGMEQGTVSKIESRSDLPVSTVRAYVAALGGRMALRLELGDEVIAGL